MEAEETMFQETERGVRVVLLGLPTEVAESLVRIVYNWASVVYIPPLFTTVQSLSLIREVTADLLFVWTAVTHGTPLLDLIRKVHPQLPVVAVSLHATDPGTLNALDSGAVDYCTPPFDLTHIQWLLQATRKVARGGSV